MTQPVDWLDELIGPAIVQVAAVTVTSPVRRRKFLNFVSGATCADNPTTDSIDVTVSGGSGVTWAGDLAGSSSSTQIVVQLSGPGSSAPVKAIVPVALQGSTVASTGDIRGQLNSTLVAYGASNYYALLSDSSGNLYVGAAVGGGSNASPNTRMYGGSTCGFIAGANSTYVLASAGGGVTCVDSGVTCAVLGVAGLALDVAFAPVYLGITPSNGTNNLTTTQSRATVYNLAAGATGAVTIASTVAPATGQLVLVRNNTSQVVTWQWSSGTGVTLASGTSAWITSDGTNAVKMMSGT